MALSSVLDCICQGCIVDASGDARPRTNVPSKLPTDTLSRIYHMDLIMIVICDQCGQST